MPEYKDNYKQIPCCKNLVNTFIVQTRGKIFVKFALLGNT